MHNQPPKADSVDNVGIHLSNADTDVFGCVFTICNIKYLPQALTAIDSYSRHHNVNHKAIVLIDSERSCEINGIKILTVEDVTRGASKHVPFSLSEIFKHYDITSACTAIKPLSLIYLRELCPDSAYHAYIDPDTYWLDSFSLDLSKKQLYFFRHRDYLCSNDGYSGKNFLAFGGVNLGLFVDTGSPIDTLISWHVFALPINFESAMLGYYTDQKPADLMVLSGRAHVLYDERINLSYWNIADVSLRKRDNTFVVKQFEEEKPLAMYHFSGYRATVSLYSGERKDQYINSPSVDGISAIHEVYTSEVRRNADNLKNYDIKSNGLGTASHAEIFKYLYLSKFSEGGGWRHTLTKWLMRFDYFSNVVARFYKIKNPLKI
jgi:hypothetical protein